MGFYERKLQSNIIWKYKLKNLQHNIYELNQRIYKIIIYQE